MFSENIHHIIISKYTLKCTQLNYFSDEHIPSNPLAIKLNSVIRTVGSTTQGGCITKITPPPPLFGHSFYPRKMTIHSGTPPPLVMIGYVTIMPCQRSHRRKIPTAPLSGPLRPPPPGHAPEKPTFFV